jgi:hypothetical protein
MMTDEQVEAWRAQIDAKRDANRVRAERDAADRAAMFEPSAEAVRAVSQVPKYAVTCPSCGGVRQATRRRRGTLCRPCAAKIGRAKSLAGAA